MNPCSAEYKLFPVILPVPDNKRQLAGREKVAFLSKYARRALEISAQKSGIALAHLIKDKYGAPIPCKGIFWSLTHKPEYVGGVVAPIKAGIDIEKIKPCSQSLFRKVADEKEWALADTDPYQLFFRYWTAKEAVLKAEGTGIKDLLKCRVLKIIDEKYLTISYRNHNWSVEQIFFDKHIASVIKNRCHVQWIRLP